MCLKNLPFLFTVYAIWIVFTTSPSFINFLCFINIFCSDYFWSGSCFMLCCAVSQLASLFIPPLVQLLHTTFECTLIVPEPFKCLPCLCWADGCWWGQEGKAKSWAMVSAARVFEQLHVCALPTALRKSRRRRELTSSLRENRGLYSSGALLWPVAGLSRKCCLEVRS